MDYDLWFLEERGGEKGDRKGGRRGGIERREERMKGKKRKERRGEDESKEKGGEGGGERKEVGRAGKRDVILCSDALASTCRPHAILLPLSHPPPLPHSTHLFLLAFLLVRNNTLLNLLVMLKNCLLQSC